MEAAHSSDDGSTPLEAARKAIKTGETQKALGLLAAIRLDRMTDEEKQLLVVVVRAAHLESQLAGNIKEAKEDRNISLIEAARILMVCREYLSINPDNPRMQKLASQCRTILAKTQGDGAADDKGMLTAAIAVRYLEDNDSVDLNDFLSLTEEAAQVLSLHDGNLSLSGLRLLSPESASALSRHAGSLSLRGLTTLSDGVASALARCVGDQLDLDGVTDLGPDVARSLASYRGKRLSLDGLKQLSEEVASSLASCKADLSLWGITSLSLGAAKALSHHGGSLSLYRLDSPSVKVWEALEANSGLVVSDAVISRMSPRIKALDEAANQAAPTDIMSVLWDWDRRETLTKDEYPDIPGGYGGPLERPAMARLNIEKEGDHWHYRVGVLQLDNEFPVEKLQAEAQRILDAVQRGIPVKITVENAQPATDSECEFFYGTD